MHFISGRRQTSSACACCVATACALLHAVLVQAKRESVYLPVAFLLQ